MKAELFSNAGSRDFDYYKVADAPQARCAAQTSLPNAPGLLASSEAVESPTRKSSPVLQLLTPRVQWHQGIALRPDRLALSRPARREMLASLRAVELAIWQASGGDVLLASYRNNASPASQFAPRL